MNNTVSKRPMSWRVENLTFDVASNLEIYRLGNNSTRHDFRDLLVTDSKYLMESMFGPSDQQSGNAQEFVLEVRVLGAACSAPAFQKAVNSIELEFRLVTQGRLVAVHKSSQTASGWDNAVNSIEHAAARMNVNINQAFEEARPVLETQVREYLANPSKSISQPRYLLP